MLFHTVELDRAWLPVPYIKKMHWFNESGTAFCCLCDDDSRVNLFENDLHSVHIKKQPVESLKEQIHVYKTRRRPIEPFILSYF
jgi:hypothetical protein